MGSTTGDGVNIISPANSNMRTREDWLRVIIHSGQVTRIAQHLALVIYHLTDTTTNVAKLSARDLEKITGWSKTVIVKHLRELHEFILVTWGAGRAKSRFELQGVIAEEMAKKKIERAAATTDATTVATEVAATASGNELATVVAASVATTDVVATTLPQANTDSSPPSPKRKVSPCTPSKENNPSPQITHTPAAREDARAPDWTIEEGCFAGQLFELSEPEYTGMQRAYGNLEFPAEMVSADAFFASKFVDDKRPPRSEQMAALHNYLNTQNRKAGELRRQVVAAAASKPGKAAAPMIGENADRSACWMDETGLHLVNGYRAEWLKKFDENEERLDMAIKEIAPYVKPNSPTPLVVQVDGKLGKIIGEKLDKDTRYTKASKPEKGISRLKEKFLRAGE